ncbi:MAG: glycosyltransferase family 2 protein [Roseococcus sp.]|nr:glycosyltransferase family 2 protein [Roseococcus sp.]
MEILLALITLGAIALILHHHLAWPLILRRAARHEGPSPTPIARHLLPYITLVMPAHNEALFIARKIANLAALDYPREQLHIIVAADGCTDDTVARAQAALREAGLSAEVREFRRNRGKVAVLNEVVGSLRGGIVALTDVSALLPADALQRIAAHFADPELGAVGGTYLLEKAGSAGEAKYWRWQVAAKRGEAALGAPLGLHGAFWAFRREAFEPLAADTINDDFILPMGMVLRGWRVAYDASILVREAERSSPAQDLRRRRRIAAGNMQQLLRLLPLLHPRHAGVALAFLSGKALRVMMPLLIVIAALGTALLAPGSTFFTLLAITEIAGFAAALAGLALGARAPRLLAFAAYALAGHAASGFGAARYMLSRPSQPWRRAAQ